MGIKSLQDRIADIIQRSSYMIICWEIIPAKVNALEKFDGIPATGMQSRGFILSLSMFET